MSKRVRKVWLSGCVTVAGTVLLGGLIYWFDLLRNTDLANGREQITTWARDDGLAAKSPIRFRDVATDMGITMRHGPGQRGRLLTEDTGSGMAWGDYDNDGDWDLYIVNLPGPQEADRGAAAANRLYRNDGDRFTDVTGRANVADVEGIGMGAWFVDYDADGDQDLYVTNYGPNRLFQNQGDGSFVDVADQAGVADPAWSTGAAFGDFDRDGDLDFYVCNYVDYQGVAASDSKTTPSTMGTMTVPYVLNPNSFDPAPNRLYRNRGDGSFVDVARQLGVANPEGRSLEATLCDLNGDGWLDLYVNNDVSANKLFRNPTFVATAGEESPFVDRSVISGTADTRGSMGLSLGEIGQMDDAMDGLPDLFITHWIAQENAFYLSHSTEAGELYYLDKTRQFGLAQMSTQSVGWGSVVADLDLDGYEDLFVANGNTLEEARNGKRQLKQQAPFVLWNTGDQFLNVASFAGSATTSRHSARGLAAADFDNDGDVDLAISINRGRPLLLRNNTKTDHRSIKVTLAGHPAVCFGARVSLTVGDHQQVKWLGGDASFLCMHAPELIFGIGTDEQAGSIHVRWADGSETVRHNVDGRAVNIRHAGTSPDAGI